MLDNINKSLIIIEKENIIIKLLNSFIAKLSRILIIFNIKTNLLFTQVLRIDLNIIN